MAEPNSAAELGDAVFGLGTTITYEAGEAITSGDAVAINSGQLATADDTTDTNIIGIAGDDAESGENVTVHVEGVVVANVAGGISAGEELGTSATEGQLGTGSDGIEALSDEGAVSGLSAGFNLDANSAVVKLA